MPRTPREGLWWSPEAGQVHDDGRPIRAVVHLAGDNLGSGRWTQEKRQQVWRSRVEGTRGLARWLRERPKPPEVFISASAVGYYGDRGEEVLDESSGAGSGFLSELCRDWEAAAFSAESIRVVVLRLGVILAPEGGALARMLPLFRLGLGGPLGTGRQWFPWVQLGDVVGAVRWAMETPTASGPYNVVAPGCLRQAEFARALGRRLGRPAVLPAPAFGLRLALGDMADEMLLASSRVVPGRLQAEGFVFEHADVEGALAALPL